MNKPIDCVRALCRDMVSNAGSGHLGMSLGASSLVYALFRNVLNVSPQNPDFFNRDRVIFSAGHCTPLIYSILHLFGYDITVDDLRNFRKLGSPTGGHPEIQTCGIDCSTGQLGQGIANAVGLAIAEKHLASIFNKPNFNLVDHYTYAIVGEGCLMEGISYESMSIAGELNLNKLIVLYDCNKITIDGTTSDVFSEDLENRVRAQNWSVFRVETTEDMAGITKAIMEAKASNRPSLVIVPSVIGLGTNDAGKPSAHTGKVTREDAVTFRELNGLPVELFNIPREMYFHFEELKTKASKMEFLYSQMLAEYKKKYKKEYELFIKYLKNDFKLDFEIEKGLAFTGRDVGNLALNKLNEFAPNLLCGSADLFASTRAYLKNKGYLTANTPQGQNIKFGTREFAMSAICSGIGIHGGLVPVCSTFLIFADYLKASMRMSALMHAKSIYVFTHDTLQIGYDGPSHQPIEQIDMLRSIPNLQVFRPCSQDEVVFAFKKAYSYFGPSAIILSKEKLAEIQSKDKEMEKGIYLAYQGERPIANIYASGTDMKLALEIRDEFLKQDLDLNVYSMLNVPNHYARPIEPKINCVIECGSAYTVQHIVGSNGMLVCTRKFGQSGNGEELYANRGFNAENIVNKLLDLCK